MPTTVPSRVGQQHTKTYLYELINHQNNHRRLISHRYRFGPNRPSAQKPQEKKYGGII